MQCYLTGVTIDDSNNSLEHILPNALGGVLAKRGILTTEANQALSVAVDTPFNRIFEGTYRRLPLKKDRSSKTGISGLHREFKTEVIFKDDKWFPKRPYFDDEKSVIYAQTAKIGEGYIRHLKKEKVIAEDRTLTVRTDLSGEFEIPFDLDNEIFSKGMAKIAAGYAAMNSISRTNMKRVIDLERNCFGDEIPVFPFFPVQPIDSVFEIKAYISDHYPIHGLSLRGIAEERLLFCYVELFSTFQYIVILDDDYDGENLHHTYIYDLLASEEITGADYIGGVFDSTLMIDQLKDYKGISKAQLDEIADIIYVPEEIKPYTATKFSQLEAFVAFLGMNKKLELLDQQFNLNNSGDDVK